MAAKIISELQIPREGKYFLVDEAPAVPEVTATQTNQNRFLDALGLEVFTNGFLIKHFRERRE